MTRTCQTSDIVALAGTIAIITALNPRIGAGILGFIAIGIVYASVKYLMGHRDRQAVREAQANDEWQRDLTPQMMPSNEVYKIK